MSAVTCALSKVFVDEMQVYVPIEPPEDLLTKILGSGSLKKGDVFTIDETVGIKFTHWMVKEEEGKYYIPLFTSKQELNKTEKQSCINQTLGALLENIDNWKDCLGFIINPGDKYKCLVLGRNMIKLIPGIKPKSNISAVMGSVLDMKVDAIVSSADTNLSGSGGIDGSIHRAAGPALLEECVSLNGCRVGEAKITGAYNITDADYIIHTVGPKTHRKKDRKLLEACYKNSLNAALENGCTSIAFPCISTGANGYPLADAAMTASLAAMEWIEEHKDKQMDIYFCCFREKEAAAYKALWHYFYKYREDSK